MRKRAWFLYPCGAALATALYLVTGRQSFVFNLIGLSSPVMIVVAVRMHRPDQRLPWYLFSLGQALFIAGDVLAYNYEKFFHSELPSPAISDLFYLSVYPCIVVGLFLMIRQRHSGRDRGTLIDATMITVGVGTLSWVFLISPYVRDTTITGLQKAVYMGYPVMDILLIAFAVRLAVGAGRKAPAFTLIMMAIVALFVTDAIYGWLLLHNGYTPGTGPLEVGWIAFYTLFGAAALHPSMRTMSEDAAASEPRVGTGRLTMLAFASLLAPLAQVIQLWQEHDVSNLPVILGATITLFVLAVVRMAGLVRRQQQSADREKALRQAGASLVTATNRSAIHDAATQAAISLTHATAAIRMCEQPEEGGALVVVASSGGLDDATGTEFSLDELQDWKLQRLMERDAYVVSMHESAVGDPLRLRISEDGSVFVAPLFLRDELHGLMVVASEEPMPASVADSLRALSSQVALALESATLTEDLLLQQSEARFASLVKNSTDVVTVIEPDTVVRYASPSAARVFGYEPAELEGMKFADLVGQEDKTKVMAFLLATGEGEGHTAIMEFKIQGKNREPFYAETLRTSLLHDQNVRGIVLNTRDISERKAFEEQLSHQAFHDSVTNLANRALFTDRVEHAVERQERDHKPIAVLFMDIDDFKTINDSLGHAAGDQLLAEVGERLKATLRAADTAARLGGDEFAILLDLDEEGEGVQAADVADRVMQMLEAPFTLDGKEVFVRASVGIAVAEGDEILRSEDLLRNADVAMYMAKERGKGRYQVFEPEMHDTALKRLEMKADLQRALEHDEFVLFYQPVIELESGRVSGVEALIRWIHPGRGMVAPLDFIPLAEETGLIVPIGRWVLRTATTYAKALQEAYPMDPPFHMAVNLSARQLSRPEIVDEVRDILGETGLDPHSLILEITESVMMQDMELSIERLTELKSLGVQLAIDDFGTGYSSLNYVRRFPVDILKVDKSFIDGVSEGGESSALTAAVIELAAILGLKPVAEGIERADQLQRLLELHCDLGQGFFFAKPLPGTDLESLLTERRDMESEIDAISKS
jgi:diguanylate cyclase (GGDEF)-like protein/PAS domain S-box-containing protein